MCLRALAVMDSGPEGVRLPLMLTSLEKWDKCVGPIIIIGSNIHVFITRETWMTNQDVYKIKYLNNIKY